MKPVEKHIANIGFVLISLTVLISPWLFGAWEMWWFWPFVALICLAMLMLAARLILVGLAAPRGPTVRPWPRTTPPMTAAVLCFLPFLVYALIRMQKTDVDVDAERSFLLFLTPFCIALHIIYGLDDSRRTRLFRLLLLDLCLLGLYGIINHEITGSQKVLWAPGFPNYWKGDRASGSYFCPDHYAGILEFSFGVVLAALLTRKCGWRWKSAAAVIGVISLWGILLSKSRGSGLTVLVVLGCALIWGFWQWRPRLRWTLRAMALTVVMGALAIFTLAASAYTERFMSYFGGEKLRGKSLAESREIFLEHVEGYARPQMYAAALRAWRTEPAFGIGPGMHQNLWPHFAASPDGDRETGRWPRYTNSHFHSYEVHSDWLQLLEEYGLVGIALFLVPTLAVLALLLAGLHRSASRMGEGRYTTDSPERHIILMGALFAWVAMTFHSLGDFNLQMPATTWMFAALISIGLSAAARELLPAHIHESD